MSETTLEKPQVNSAPAPMVDLQLLLNTPEMNLRRAYILYCIHYGIDNNGRLAEVTGSLHSLISYEVAALRKLGYLQPAEPHAGPRVKPIYLTNRGTRLCSKMVRKY